MRHNCSYYIIIIGRALAQELIRWLPTAAAQVRAQVWSCGICGGQSGAWARFLRVLRFPLKIFIPPTAPQLPSPIIWGWYNRPVVAAVPSGHSLTPIRIIIKIVLYYIFFDDFSCFYYDKLHCFIEAQKENLP
jgi:hypothetical protein